jgi:SAM-dependent methyltransferase
VLSRHEALDPSEVARVLRPGGRLLTQQVIHDYWHELAEWFPDYVSFSDHFIDYQRAAIEAGLVVEDARRRYHQVRFRELGPLVYHLVAAPWMVPEFGIETHGDGLEQLARRIERDGELRLTAGYHLLQFAKPPAS